MMDTPRRRRMALQGIENQLPQVGPEGRAVAQHEGRADGHAFAAFAGQAQGNLQQCGDMPRHAYGQKTRNRLNSRVYDPAMAQTSACMLPIPSRILDAN